LFFTPDQQWEEEQKGGRTEWHGMDSSGIYNYDWAQALRNNINTRFVPTELANLQYA